MDGQNNENTRIPVNGGVIINITEDKLSAFLHITQEKDGGEPITFEEITREIDSLKIAVNVDYESIKKLLDEKRYNKKICIAQGSLPTHGKDGRIHYLFEPTSELVPKKGKTGEVDYKDLGLVRNITAGEVIAEIVFPEDGKDGENVFGHPLPAIPGKPAKYGVGNGTALTEDESQIKSTLSGNLSWAKDRFVVNETLVISENVDVATGNIDFIGNVVIKGFVAEGFSVKTKMSVTVNGTVTGAEIIAGGDVIIALGIINSNITAQGTVKLGFCQNSKVECQGDFFCQSVIGGEVFCAGEINVVGGKGVILGGKHTALSGFSANVIGTENYTKTQITLGNSAVLTEEKLDLEHKIRDLEERTKKLLQVAEVLQEHKKNLGQLPPDREAMLTTAIRSRFTFQREIKQLYKRIEEIDKELGMAGDQFVVVHKHIWPGVTVRVGTELLIVDRHLTSVLIGKDAGGTLAYLPYKK